MLQSCCQNVKNGQKRKAVQNLPATANLIIQIVTGFTCLWDLRKPTGLYASENTCRSVV